MITNIDVTKLKEHPDNPRKNICAARERLEELTASPWISVNDRLPEDEQGVLVIASGRPREHLELDCAHELATFYAGEGWLFEAYPDWDDPQVTYWMPLPELPTIE